ncbi:MAG: transcription antitermination factor NusB [Candidatus Omnitrophica bacterium]|nr:transcription antitermination factor NusB [Candidatus Omnitrophota bacterium]
MRKRTLARELVLKVLYQADIRKESMSLLAKSFSDLSEINDSEIKDFASVLISGIEKNLKDIDAKIFKYASNWDISRMAFIDRNVLRMGIFELLYMPDVPSKVSINEAIELVKKYGDIESSKFVNGILDKAHKENPVVKDKKS